MKPPCYGCTEREVGCHAKCEKYMAFNEERQQERQKRLNALGLNGILADHEARNVKFRKRFGTSRNSKK